jgi:phosphotransferase system HPr-like phosphotransfer protein
MGSLTGKIISHHYNAMPTTKTTLASILQICISPSATVQLTASGDDETEKVKSLQHALQQDVMPILVSLYHIYLSGRQ